MAPDPENRRESVHCSLSTMPEFMDLNGFCLLGASVTASPPIFHQGNSSPAGWVPFHLSGLSDVRHQIVPIRAMCINIPVEYFQSNATKFNEWQTPADSSLRAASVAALVGLFFTPLSKGFPDNDDEEQARGEHDGNQQGGHRPRRVTRWMMPPSADQPELIRPQFCLGMEDIYDSAQETVVAIRLWHLVFHEEHSTSGLARKLMKENADEADHSGAAHCPNSMRKQNNVSNARHMRSLVGSSLESAELEIAAGVMYRHITSEAVFKNLLPHYAGQSDRTPGRPAIDVSQIPAGTMNHQFVKHRTNGCMHPLALEWVFNAKREAALCAGLVKPDGSNMDVHPEQMDPTNYFDMSSPALDESEGDTHKFRPPKFVSTSTREGGKGCFYFQTDPYQINPFDMSLPHPISGTIKPGQALLELYRERFCDDQDIPLDSVKLLNMFNNHMTGRSQFEQQSIAAMQNSVINYDTMDTSNEQRSQAKALKAAMAQGLASYGQHDGDSPVIEPRQVLKEHAFSTNNVHTKLIAPWAEEQRNAFVCKFALEHDSDALAKLREEQDAFYQRLRDVTDELVKLHLANCAFVHVKTDRSAIPSGFRGLEGLQRALRPNRQRGVRLGTNGMQMTDRTARCTAHELGWGVFRGRLLCRRTRLALDARGLLSLLRCVLPTLRRACTPCSPLRAVVVTHRAIRRAHDVVAFLRSQGKRQEPAHRTRHEGVRRWVDPTFWPVEHEGGDARYALVHPPPPNTPECTHSVGTRRPLQATATPTTGATAFTTR